MKLYPHHPLADLFPMISGAQLEAFIEDVGINKLQVPILLVKEGRQLLVADGRTRQLACEKTGVEPRYVKWDGVGDLLDVICSLNLKHRSMSKTDLAVSAEAAMRHIELSKEDAAKLQPEGNVADRIAKRQAELAAIKFGVSARYVYQVRAVRRASPSVYKLLRNRELNLSQAALRVERVRRLKDTDTRAAEAKIGKGDLKLVCGDAIEEMDRLPAECATVVFVDPPYNNGWVYDSDPHADALGDAGYLDLMMRVFNSALRILAPNGSLFVLIDDNYSDQIGMLLRTTSRHRRNTIIWWETFGVHQTGNFSKCARFLHYYTKQPRGFIWHPEPVESARQKLGDARANHDGKCPDNVWQISRVNGNDADRVPFEDAPPQVPVELPRRAIIAASEPGDLVVDCFNGNGTTGLAALLTGRRYIGIDRSAKYLKQSETWIKARLADRSEK